MSYSYDRTAGSPERYTRAIDDIRKALKYIEAEAKKAGDGDTLDSIREIRERLDAM